eukprot:6533918-Pyramimonas_sp.AAC.1
MNSLHHGEDADGFAAASEPVPPIHWQGDGREQLSKAIAHELSQPSFVIFTPSRDIYRYSRTVSPITIGQRMAVQQLGGLAGYVGQAQRSHVPLEGDG